MNTKELLKEHKLPCGPMSVGIDKVCRRRLRDQHDALLDQLTKVTHPQGRESDDDEPDGYDEVRKQQLRDDEMKRRMEANIDSALDEEPLDQKKKRLIEEGRMKAEVKKEVRTYEEKLMGNSKLLQDISGKTKKR